MGGYEHAVLPRRARTTGIGIQDFEQVIADFVSGLGEERGMGGFGSTGE